MIDFYIILIQWTDVLLERGVMDLDVQEWTLITGRREVGFFPEDRSSSHKHTHTHTHTHCALLAVTVSVGVCARARTSTS